MIELSRFTLYYFSEMNIDILYRYLPDRDMFKISATHSNRNVPISCWFHFIDKDIPDRRDPLFFESEDRVEPLAKMSAKLSPAAEFLLEQHDVENPQRQFFTDFMCGLAIGHYSINDRRDVEYTHDAGEWLMNYYDENIDVEWGEL